MYDVVYYRTPGFVRSFTPKPGGCYEDGAVWYTFADKQEAIDKAGQLQASYGPRETFRVMPS